MLKRSLIIKHSLLAVFVLGVVWSLFQVNLPPTAIAHLQFTATPGTINLPQVTSPPGTNLATRTPTEIGPVSVEALDEGGSNVRGGPDIEAERLGMIYPGTTYPVLGRAAGTLWLQIRFPDSPNGTAWVFEQVVQIIGDEGSIPDIENVDAAVIDAGAVITTQTLEALAQTPGALETIQAQESFASGSEATRPVGPSAPLPTFTYPPGQAAAQPTALALPPGSSAPEDGGFPPIIPILGLAAVGGVGFLIAIVRRLS